MTELLIIAFSVAADATAVAIAASLRGIHRSAGIALACAFGASQSLMASLGWLGGKTVGRLWEEWDHWVALALLTFVGAKMIKEALADDCDERPPLVAGAGSILMLSIATSIDALAVGVSLPALRLSLLTSIGVIGVVTLVFSAAGVAFGRFLGERFGQRMEIAGGAALIGIGIKIVVASA